jgi:hypothetical protein
MPSANPVCRFLTFFSLVAGVSGQALADRGELWSFRQEIEAGEQIPVAAFMFPESQDVLLQARCDRLTHNFMIEYFPGKEISQSSEDTFLTIKGDSIIYPIRAEVIDLGVVGWSRPTSRLLDALHQPGGFRIAVPAEREPLNVGRAEPLQRVAELCQAINSTEPKEFEANRALGARPRTYVTVTLPEPSSPPRERLEISATSARYENLSGQMTLEYAGRTPDDLGGETSGADVYRVANAEQFFALNGREKLNCSEPILG